MLLIEKCGMRKASVQRPNLFSEDQRSVLPRSHPEPPALPRAPATPLRAPASHHGGPETKRARVARPGARSGTKRLDVIFPVAGVGPLVCPVEGQGCSRWNSPPLPHGIGAPSLKLSGRSQRRRGSRNRGSSIPTVRTTCRFGGSQLVRGSRSKPLYRLDFWFLATPGYRATPVS